MMRTFLAFSLAAAIGGSVSLAAQSSTSPRPRAGSADREMTLTGCVQKNASGGFWLTRRA